jgi:organic hydroperoxide reductase OsmC/OhrA
MGFKHLFKAEVKWKSNEDETKLNPKNHEIIIEGKPKLSASAAKAFKGDPKLYNPEDMLLSSLVSCHMMSYFYVCGQNGIEVLAYSDNAEAILEVEFDGSGRFTEVRLNPKVTIANPDKIQLALELHKKANQLCFIANSCNFLVLHNPSCEAV